MNSAILHNGQVVTAREYNVDVHGTRLYCLDESCKVPVIFISGSNVVPHFKTTGKNDSKHNESCGFYKPLDFIDSIKKVGEYQNKLLGKGIKETLIRVNLNKLDPDYESRVIERERSDKKEKEEKEIKIKQDNEPPSTVGSLKSIVKLMNTYEPDILSTILVNTKGRKLPISNLILDQEQAHNLLWSDQNIPGIGYFVYGQVDGVIRREKVIYINFQTVNNVKFSLVVFDKYFQHFSYTDAELIGKDILTWGELRKNTYEDKNTTEIAIKSDKYLEFL